MKTTPSPTSNARFARIAAAGLISMAILAGSQVRAEETLGEKTATQIDEAKTGMKKTVRKAKRQHRKATGRDNVILDAKDAANDAGNDIGTTTRKAVRKAD